MANMQIVPARAGKNVEAQYVELKVPLYSYGCEKKIKKALSHLKGIYSVNVNCEEEKVTVWGICNKYDVLETVRSKRKDARFWNEQDNLVDEDPQPPSISNSHSQGASLKIVLGRSLSWKAFKKVFARSYSF